MNTAAIENLRNREVEQGVKPTLAQVRALVNGLQTNTSLAETAREMGVDEGVALDVTALLGTWLTHVHGGAGVETTLAVDAEQQVLFQVASQQEVTGKKSRKTPTTVVIPPGFERTAEHKRDVSKAVASIVVANPTDETLGRFLARTYQTQARVLTFPHVADVWLMARLGRLGSRDPQAEQRLSEGVAAVNATIRSLKNNDSPEAKARVEAARSAKETLTTKLALAKSYNLDSVSPNNAVLAELYVEAFDLLDIARADAIQGIERLVSRDVSDLDEVAHACRKAKWIAEGEVATIERSLEAAQRRPESLHLLERELGFFAQRVARAPGRYKPRSIATLNAGQVLRIAQAAGLQVENDSEMRSLENQVRNGLKEKGLSSDLDRLVSIGVKATTGGREEDFWEVIDQRVGGNPEWFLLLKDLVESL